MRRPLTILLLLAVATVTVTIAACGQDASHGEHAAERWQCPMHPQVVQDEPGDCPICGMKLQPIAEESTAEEAEPAQAGHVHGGGAPVPTGATPPGGVPGRAVVTIDPARQQLIGLRLASVQQAELGAGFTSPARVEADPDRVRKVTVKIGGTVERVAVDAAGRRVRRGDPLFSLYSPELQVAQGELLLALGTREKLAAAGDAGGDVLVEAARRKLGLLDVPAAEIARIEAGGEPRRTISFAAPAAGLVTVRGVIEGDTLQPGDVAFELTELGSVWLVADARQSDLPRVSQGQRVTFTVDALPGRGWEGDVVLVEPALDPTTRTARVHVHVDNPDGALVPGMFGRAAFGAAPRAVLAVPLDAVLPAGKRDLAFVALGEGRFAPREVQLGARDEERVEVLAGLAEGEQVVTRAAFLVDSESSLRAALSALE